jgi:predicted RNase H-like nuclease
MAAYTAFQAACTPDEVVLVGDETEGRMVLPVRQLKARYDS